MAARAKLTATRETRLLALLAFGESFAASCRAIGISAQAVRKRAHRDLAFAERLAAARENRSLVEADWRAAARQLEHDFPEHWKLDDADGDPFDFDFDPLA